MAVESEEGAGSVFCFNIRATAAESPLPDYLRARQPALAGCRALIVENHGINRELLSRWTAFWGMIPRVEDRGDTAIKILREEPRFALALVSYKLPDMDSL